MGKLNLLLGARLYLTHGFRWPTQACVHGSTCFAPFMGDVLRQEALIERMFRACYRYADIDAVVKEAQRRTTGDVLGQEPFFEVCLWAEPLIERMSWGVLVHRVVATWMHTHAESTSSERVAAGQSRIFRAEACSVRVQE